MIPTFETTFLSEIGESIRRRQKALKHKTFGMKCERAWESSEGLKREKLELTLSGPPRSKDAQLRFFAWSDRWIWADAREGGTPGWKWEWTVEGSVLGNVTGRDVVNAVESSYSASPFLSDRNFKGEINAIWKPLLKAKLSLVD